MHTIGLEGLKLKKKNLCGVYHICMGPAVELESFFTSKAIPYKHSNITHLSYVYSHKLATLACGSLKIVGRGDTRCVELMRQTAVDLIQGIAALLVCMISTEICQPCTPVGFAAENGSAVNTTATVNNQLCTYLSESFINTYRRNRNSLLTFLSTPGVQRDSYAAVVLTCNNESACPKCSAEDDEKQAAKKVKPAAKKVKQAGGEAADEADEAGEGKTQVRPESCRPQRGLCQRPDAGIGEL
jgi:hypothetical protein